MNKIALTLSLTLGCAAQNPSIASGIAKVHQGLVEIDRSTWNETKRMTAAMDATIARCRDKNLPTPEDRKACLGEWGKPLPLDSLQWIRDAYNRIAEDIQVIERHSSSIERRTP